jgi:hypothetical protein
MQKYNLFGALIAATILSGCTYEAREEVHESASELVIVNGAAFNGPLWNGLTLNGLTLNGLTLNGLTLNGTQIQSASLTATVFSGTYQGAPISGEDFAGTKISGTLSDGSPILLSIETIDPSPNDPEILHYIISYDNGGPQPWPYLCGTDDNGPVAAIPLNGWWNYMTGDFVNDTNRFTIACRGYVLAKCTEAGYKPWDEKPECMSSGSPCQTISLRSLHQACTRMIRADYCGDGHAHTVDGTLIDIYDFLGIQSRTGLQSPTFEAEWTPEGAACVKAARLNSTSAQTYIQNYCSSKWQPNSADCGGSTSTFFADNGFSTPLDERSLIRNEF